MPMDDMQQQEMDDMGGPDGDLDMDGMQQQQEQEVSQVEAQQPIEEAQPPVDASPA